MCVHREIYDVICKQPGSTIYFVAKALECQDTDIKHRIDRLDFHGFFISEDVYGGLYPFRETEPEEARLAWQQVRRG